MKSKRTNTQAPLREITALRRRLTRAERVIAAMRHERTSAPPTSAGQYARGLTTLEAELPYRLMFEAMNEGALILSESGIIHYANTRFSEMVKVPIEDLLGTPLRAFVVRAHWEELSQLLRKGREGREADEITLWSRQANFVPAHFSLVPLKSNGALQICAVVTDLSAVIAARRNRLQLASIVASSDDAIFTIGPRGTILTWNDAAEKIFGYKAHQVVGQPLHILSPADPRLDGATPVGGHTLGQGLKHFQTVMVRQDGERIDVAVTVSPIANTAASSALIIRDITASKQRERQLRQQTGKLLAAEDEERRRFSKNLHESTAQNLAALIIEVDMLAKTLRNEGSHHQYLDEIASLARQCTEEVRNLARLLHPPALEEVGLASALHAYVENFSQSCGMRMDLETSTELGSLPRVVEGAIFRVVQEALTNLYRRSGSTTAQIRISRKARGILVEISDEGKGMPITTQTSPESLRAPATRPPPVAGLSTIRERVELLGGELEIDSTSQGVTVRASFPLPHTESHEPPLESPAGLSQ